MMSDKQTMSPHIAFSRLRFKMVFGVWEVIYYESGDTVMTPESSAKLSLLLAMSVLGASKIKDLLMSRVWCLACGE
jgi:hypothetical protein